MQMRECENRMNETEARNRFAANLKYYLKASGMDQKQFAERIGRTTSAVSDWATGKKLPRIDTCYEITKILNVSFPELVNGPGFEEEHSPKETTVSHSFCVCQDGRKDEVGIQFSENGEVIFLLNWKCVSFEELYSGLNVAGKRQLLLEILYHQNLKDEGLEKV